MKLINLTLTNFEGVKLLNINVNGKSLSVYGDNGTGKTTIADAQTWLLFDKDSQFTANFSPKMRNFDGEDIHNIECSVKAVYEINGTNVILEKVLKEDWKKKRGSTEAVFSGHKVTYFIDGVPKKEKEYQEYLNSICDIQKLMLLSTIRYFPEILDIKKRRDVLMSLIGSVSDFDVINSNEELNPLLHLLLKPNTTQMWYSVDEFLKICKSKSAEINKELKEIPGRIDEVSRQINENDFNVDTLKSELAKLTTEKSNLVFEINKTSNEQVLSLKESISKEKIKLSEAKENYIDNSNKINKDISDKINKLNEQRYELNNRIRQCKDEITFANKNIENITKKRADLLEKYSDVQSQQWQGDTVCPTCGQAIPNEQIEKAKEQFNLLKSKKLEELNEFGKENCSKAMIEENQNRVNEWNSELEKYNKELEHLEKEIENAHSQLVKTEIFENTVEYKQINNIIEGMKAQIQLIEQSEGGNKVNIQNNIDDIDTQISEINIKLAEYEASEKSRKRITELEEKEQILADEYAKAQQGIYLCELFSRTKADMLTNKINSKFNNVRFRLFKQQINGGIADDCEVMANTTTGYMPYSTANNAAKISAGLDIIRTFSKAWNVQMPVFVDNAESITKLDSDGLQVLKLVVSENDKTLRFETEEN